LKLNKNPFLKLVVDAIYANVPANQTINNFVCPEGVHKQHFKYIHRNYIYIRTTLLVIRSDCLSNCIMELYKNVITISEIY